MSLNQLTITQAHNGLKKKEFSSVELTEAVLSQIKERDRQIHAYLTLTEELALSQAKRVDKKIANREEIGSLAGVPVAIKDLILVEGVRCTAGSKILAEYIAPYDATAVKKLRQAGAIIIGKTNLDEFGMGSSTENSAYGITRNPHDLERVPGGSSGGSAAALAADECIYALGTDTGGSIRQPASFCGVFGLKPTYGRISRYGLIAFASSLDQIGPMTKTAEDAWLVLKVIAGQDKMDSTSSNPPGRATKNKFQIKDLKIGLPKEYFVKGLDPEVEKTVKKAVSQYEKMGAQVIEINLPFSEYALPAYYIIQPAEASANLARYDGIKYGLSEPASQLLDVYLKTRQRGFGDEVRRRIMLGAYTLSAGYYEAYYLKAQKVRALIKEDFAKAFEKADVLMGPVSPVPAFRLGEKIDDPVSMYLSDIYTAAINLAGLPAVSLPCGRINNLPVGLQIIGRHFEEEKIIQTAQAYENISA
ncbi:MAG: Asp-tRNA(Asn)/Glu-tRNA(Gln) amidotransferase GatCAB subunit A [Candidatus Portnoybacteria bacterium CG03_land_8_20_14_0_80_41_10]|uniref:Glutamyl-tRNA(Gln) amidotransferase subunit A n=1 Tax=Candidatus Portnoybacteria bacterium CG03_land_8_20_14_0_80_41_10 TaxID=1974808 RepID=A0A2M7BVC4_9BACT|nr:MAG: Asp-tRNA(Asn)/Glu-tRNA(Gln) amidotransferase GatCAB subunit A [Candidatus Portnoybacteria bacterium CG03_land_8_20_14_0_80_41_10]